MSYIEKNGERFYPFGKGGVEEISKKQGVEILSRIKLDESFNSSCESGVVFEGLDSDIKNNFIEVAKKMAN